MISISSPIKLDKNADKYHQMCERAGLFESMDSIDYTMLTEQTFDWNLWIEQELRRR